MRICCFYAIYQPLLIRDSFEYSDKLTLSVADLGHIELATESDKAYGIDKWAALFRSISWEEILMTAKNDEYLMEATKDAEIEALKKNSRLTPTSQKNS